MDFNFLVLSVFVRINLSYLMLPEAEAFTRNQCKYHRNSLTSALIGKTFNNRIPLLNMLVAFLPQDFKHATPESGHKSTCKMR